MRKCCRRRESGSIRCRNPLAATAQPTRTSRLSPFVQGDTGFPGDQGSRSPCDCDTERRARPRRCRFPRSWHRRMTVVRLVHTGRDSSARCGACSVYENDSAGTACWPARVGRSASALAGRTVVPGFLPKRNSELIRSDGRTTDDTSRLAIGERRVSADSEAGSCFHVGAVLSAGADDTVEFVGPESGDSR
jgi:hypothetical protein